MKILISIILSFCFISNTSAMSMHDGVNFKGKIVSIASLKNLLSTELIISCMKQVDRYECQCGVDNVFKDMTADEIVKFDINIFMEKFQAAREKYCLIDPISNIPPTNSKGDMLGGEMRTFISKEVILDCLMDKKDESICRCYGDGFCREMEGKDLREFLDVIDARKYNMSKYKINKKIYKECNNKKHR